jgi:hypothetical protein
MTQIETNESLPGGDGRHRDHGRESSLGDRLERGSNLCLPLSRSRVWAFTAHTLAYGIPY